MNSEDTLLAHVRNTMGENPAAWPGGWPGEIEAALIDAIFSVRARYVNRTTGTGVYGAVSRYRTENGVPADDLKRLGASRLVKGVAARLGVDERALDHAVWRYQRQARA